MGARKKIARFEPPVSVILRTRQMMKHSTVETLPIAGIQAASAANLLMVNVGAVRALRCWSSLALGGKAELRLDGPCVTPLSAAFSCSSKASSNLISNAIIMKIAA
uniref:Uncharacterized protein n=1 Tax=Arundo donax TaxID=35708 RepID=A0A0A8YL58_ARUDO